MAQPIEVEKFSHSIQPIEIPEDEQWKLINETGILSRMDHVSQVRKSEASSSLAEEILDAVLIIIPITFLLLLMHILIHFQYGQHPTLNSLIDRLASGVPILSAFIFYTIRYKSRRSTQLFLFMLGSVSGSRMLYLLNRGSWLVNIQQCPPLATLWIYTIIQLELLPIVISLVCVALYVWWHGLKLRL